MQIDFIPRRFSIEFDYSEQVKKETHIEYSILLSQVVFNTE